jgi:hypothetical protein
VARFGLRASRRVWATTLLYLRLACNSSLLHFGIASTHLALIVRSPEGLGDKKRRREGVCEVSSTQKHLDFFFTMPKNLAIHSGLRKEKLGLPELD